MLKKYLIYAFRPGMLGNQLIIHAHLHAFAKEYNIQLLNPSFFYASYFPNFKKIQAQKIIYLLLRFITKLLLKFNFSFPLCKIVFIDWHEKIDLNEQFYNQYIRNNKFIFLVGWQFRNSDLLIKHKQDIIHLFQPTFEIYKTLQKKISEYKSNYQNIIAVHIRRGDYINFEHGRYFYDLNVYEDWIQHLEKYIFTDKKNLYLVFSNEKIETLNLKNITYQIEKNTDIEDLYLMSLCNYIIGPPSTFSMWASFYGDVPLYMVHHALDKPLSITDFKPAQI